MKITKIKNILLMITLIIILLIDFGLIVNTNNKWNETVRKIDNLTLETTLKEEYIKNALKSRNEEFSWTLNLFILSNFIGIILLYLYRKEKNEYESNLYDEKEKAIITLKSIGDGVITTDKEAVITFMNPVAEKILGYKNEESIGKNISEILNLIDTITKKSIEFNINNVLEFGKVRVLTENISLVNRYKKIYEIEDSIAPIKNKQGEILGVVFVFHDVSKQNEYRRRLIENEKVIIQQSKTSAMAEMLENMAHHWRQPLSLISTLATGLKIKKEMNDLDDEYFIDSLERINQSSQNLSKVIDDFTIFLQPNSRKKEFFFLDNTIKKVITILESNLKNKDIHIISNVEKIELNSYENELMQVFISFINNSIDILTLRDGKKYIFIDVYKNENEIIIQFLDNAGGIPMDILNRVFEPYFTTKYKSQGKGISLYISQEIIKNLINGKIKVENESFSFGNEEYIGAKFIIIFTCLSC